MRNIFKEYADLYAPLFDLMHQEHGKILLIEEMDEIILASKKVEDNFDKLAKERSKQ